MSAFLSCSLYSGGEFPSDWGHFSWLNFTLSVCVLRKGSTRIISFVCEGEEHSKSRKISSYLNRMWWQYVSLVDTQEGPQTWGMGYLGLFLHWLLENWAAFKKLFTLLCTLLLFFFLKKNSLIKLRKVFTTKDHCKDLGILNRNWSKSWKVREELGHLFKVLAIRSQADLCLSCV